MNTRKFKNKYALILKAFADNREEQYLVEAAQLGRELVQANMPPEDIAEMHEYAVKCLAEQSPDRTLLDSDNRIAAPLMEVLMAYGLVFREWLDELRESERKLLDYQTQLKSLASKLVQTEERERQHIGMVLHDNITQELIMAEFSVKLLVKSVSDSDVLGALNKIHEIISQAVEDTRLLTLEVSNPVLHELGLTAAIEQYLDEEIQQKHGIAFEFKSDERFNELDENIYTVLFRNVRELLINIVKHANAQKVKVSIRSLDGRLHICVEDDGIGFDPGKTGLTPSRTGSLGLFSIRELLGQLGGHLEIESDPDRGSKITMATPLTQKATVQAL